MPGIQFHNVSFAYRQTNVCSGVRWNIPDAAVSGLIGPNGSGKTTLLKLASGLLKPSAGAVRIGEFEIPAMNAREIARLVAYVPQVEQMVFPYTVFQMVMLGRYAHQAGPGYESPADREKVETAMDLCGIGRLRDRNVTELSGGELHRVLFARAIAQDTPVLLLDEPTAFMDIQYQVALFDLLLHMRDEFRKTIVCVTHDLNIAISYFDEVGILSGGAIAANGEPREVLSEERISQYFDIPVSVRAGSGGLPPFIQLHSPYQVSRGK